MENTKPEKVKMENSNWIENKQIETQKRIKTELIDLKKEWKEKGDSNQK